MKKLLVTAALASALLTLQSLPSAHSAIYLEPYMGYSFGSGGTTQDHSLSGVAYGLRGGWSTMGLAAGLEYHGAMMNWNTPTKSDYNPSDLGVFGAYNFPVLPIKVYGTYFFNSKVDIKRSGFNDTYKGNAVKIGLGFTTLPLIHINFDYSKVSLDKNKQGSMTNKFTADVYSLNVSVPFEF